MTDPPFGIRAGAKKIRAGAKHIVPAEKAADAKGHVQQKENYPLQDLMTDLLVFAARHLRMHGRLVFLFPTTCEYQHSDLSLHPCLTLIANSEQTLQGIFRRRLITMQKTREFSPEVQVSHPLYEPAHANLYEKYYNLIPTMVPPRKKKRHNLDERPNGAAKSDSDGPTAGAAHRAAAGANGDASAAAATADLDST